jgi:hypothetical protein
MDYVKNRAGYQTYLFVQEHWAYDGLWDTEECDLWGLAN